MNKNKILILLGLFFLESTTGCSIEDDERIERIRPVRYQKVFQIAAGQERSFSGTAQASLETTMSFKVPGTILRLYKVVGDKVLKGQSLAQLDTRDAALRVQEGEANLEKTKAEARNANANYLRTEALYENRSASLNELDQARATTDSAKAAVKLLEKQLEFLKLQLDYTHLTSPEDCSVAEIKAKENENVISGQPILTLTCGEKVKVKVTVPEAIIGFIKQNDETTVSFDAISNRQFKAKVVEVGVASSDQGTAYPVTVQLDEAKTEIRSGMAAEVLFTLKGEGLSKMVVPVSAVSEDRRGQFVYVVKPLDKETGIAHRVSVKVGELTALGLVIKKGLRDQELIITAGVTQIQDKQKVKLIGLSGN